MNVSIVFMRTVYRFVQPQSRGNCFENAAACQLLVVAGWLFRVRSFPFLRGRRLAGGGAPSLCGREPRLYPDRPQQPGIRNAQTDPRAIISRSPSRRALGILTYWAYKAHADGARLFSLLNPAPPSRKVCVWRGEGIEVVGEDTGSLTEWIRHRFRDGAAIKIETAAFLWLREPWLPAAYPETASDLHMRAVEIGDEAVQVLEQAPLTTP